jgi:hypothetical protein
MMAVADPARALSGPGGASAAATSERKPVLAPRLQGEVSRSAERRSQRAQSGAAACAHRRSGASDATTALSIANGQHRILENAGGNHERQRIVTDLRQRQRRTREGESGRDARRVAAGSCQTAGRRWLRLTAGLLWAPDIDAPAGDDRKERKR